MLRTSFPRLIPFLTALALFTGACQDSSTGPDGERVGQGKGFTLLLTDAPGDFKAAVVTISEVYLQGDGGRVNLLTTPFTGDLLDLQNSVATLVSGLEIKPGSYQELRIVVCDAYIEVETETGTKVFASSPSFAGLPAGKQVDGTLQMPSFCASGIKVKLPGNKLDIGAGEMIVMVDFDVKDSFGHEAGKSGKWVMNPVVQATDVTFGGFALARLQLGTGVTLPLLNNEQVTLGNFTARLTPVAGGAARDIVLTDVNTDGIFEAMFKGLLPGQYTLTFIAPSGLLLGFDPALPRTLTVLEKTITTETVTVSSAALPATIVATLRLNTGVTLPAVGTTATTVGQFRAQLTPSGGGTPAIVTFTDANNDGTFEASFTNLAAGTYALTLLAPAGITATYDVAVPLNVTVAAGATETKPFVINAAVLTP